MKKFSTHPRSLEIGCSLMSPPEPLHLFVKRIQSACSKFRRHGEEKQPFMISISWLNNRKCVCSKNGRRSFLKKPCSTTGLVSTASSLKNNLVCLGGCREPRISNVLTAIGREKICPKATGTENGTWIRRRFYQVTPRGENIILDWWCDFLQLYRNSINFSGVV